LISIKRNLEDNRFSQWGEENAVRQLLELVAPKTQTFRTAEDPGVLVEFGGSRGSDHSNFFRFVDAGPALVMIEGDSDRFHGLESTAARFPSLIAINAWVDDGKNSVAEILRRRDINTHNIYGISIDIDGDDALIFETLGVNPCFVVIEHNPALPLDGRFRNPKGRNVGNNLGELVAVAAQRGMFPVCVTETNIIFLDNKYQNIVYEIDVANELKSLDLMRFGIGFDGTLVRYSTLGHDTTAEFYHNGWAKCLVVQPLPRIIRHLVLKKSAANLKLAYSSLIAFLLRPISFSVFVTRYVQSRRRQRSN